MRPPLVMLVCGIMTATVLMLGAPPAYACEYNGDAATDGVLIAGYCETNEARGETPDGATSGVVAYLEYVWASVCGQFSANSDPNSQYMDCAAARSCADPNDRVWQLWGRRPPPQSGWALLDTQCFGLSEPPMGATAVVTPGMVLNELRRIGLPALEARTQPAEKTLVNFETIFFADPEPFTRTLTLLGQQVQVEARPTTYHWVHGDGTSATTSTPGAPYPAKEVTHSYVDAHVTVQTRVDVTYSARFRVNGGGWRDIAETVTITGPASPLRVAEAVPVLSGDYS